MLTILESDRQARKWTPSPTGIGIGMLVPAAPCASMFLAARSREMWRKAPPKAYEQHVTPLASGFIAGEAIIAVLIPILVVIGLIHLQP